MNLEWYDQLLLGFVAMYVFVVAAALLISFLAQRLEEVSHAPHRLKAADELRTGPSGIGRAGRVSERDDRRGPGGERP